MPSHDLKHDLRLMGLGVAVLCLAALTSPACAAGKPSASGTATDGDEQSLSAFGMDNAGITTAFESLSRPQQARVMQRCKDVMARPVEADPNKLALCQTLMPIANR